MSNTETKLISINAALAERAERLREEEAWLSGTTFDQVAARNISHLTLRALKSQIRDLETEKHALLQTVSL
jgi:hypothetical protein